MRLRSVLLVLPLLHVAIAANAQSADFPRLAQIAATSNPVLVLEDTPLHVLTTSSISTEHAREGQPLVFTLNQDIIVKGVLVVPRGATLRGVVVHAHQAGRLKGDSHLEIKLTSLELEGRTYPLYTYRLAVDRPGKGRATTIDTIGGAEYGALAGAVVAGDHPYATPAAKFADIGGGAAVGAGIGALASATTSGEAATVPAESQIDFYLAMPVAVVPVSAQEASRLARQYHPVEPSLHLRSDAP